MTTTPQIVPAGRLEWVDSLRSFTILLVVNMHACVTYSHVGGWYVMEGDDPPLSLKLPFLFWQGHLQAFFMGLLFFLAGFFADGSLRRRGSIPFFRERALRLGGPALLFLLVIHPFVVAVLILGIRDGNWSQSAPWLIRHFTSVFAILGGSGPLWFALALLVFCGVFAALPLRYKLRRPAPGPGAAVVFALGLVATTFLVRLVEPIGLNVLNFQLCFFPQYIAAFAVGTAAAQGGWLEEMARSVWARRAGILGLVVGPVALFSVVALGGPFKKVGDVAYPYAGGWHWQALAMAAWEQCSGVALGLGMLALFQSRINRPGPLSRWVSERSFGVYVLHTPVLVALTPCLRPLRAGLIGSAVILTAAGIALSFLAADLAKRIPALRRIL